MIQVKNKLNNQIYYFRFFSNNKNMFYYTPTTEAWGFDFGYIDTFEPINTTWKKIKNNRRRNE